MCGTKHSYIGSLTFPTYWLQLVPVHLSSLQQQRHERILPPIDPQVAVPVNPEQEIILPGRLGKGDVLAALGVEESTNRETVIPPGAAHAVRVIQCVEPVTRHQVIGICFHGVGLAEIEAGSGIPHCIHPCGGLSQIGPGPADADIYLRPAGTDLELLPPQVQRSVPFFR